MVELDMFYRMARDRLSVFEAGEVHIFAPL